MISDEEDAVQHNVQSALFTARDMRLAENHAAALCAAFRTGMKNGTSFRLMPVKMMAKEEFELLPKGGLFGEKTRRFTDPEKWFRYSYNKRRMCNVKLHSEPRKQIPADLGEGIRICCLYENGTASCFCPEWAYYEPTDKWSVVYREQPLSDSSLAKQRFADNTEQLRAAFLAMSDFAHSLGCEKDTSHLLCCLDELEGRQANWEQQSEVLSVIHTRIAPMHTPKLPEKLAHIYTAASRAPSWNVSMRVELRDAAENAGKIAEYNALMDRLSEQTNLAMLYAVNEC